MVGAVDAGRVVDRVGVDPAAAERVLDPRALREAEVAALADDAAAELARASTRTASFAWSPTSACVSSRAFTNVPMPPFQSRSTGARSIARISSFGVSDSSSTPSAARASGESGIDFAVRGNTPPPGEISAGS